MIMMVESGFSMPRCDAFPCGLRVLVVDDDLTWLKILEKMLKKCSYEVTTCGRAWDALKLLRDRKDGFDIVISDVNMPDMDGFKLLEHVGLEMDLPVIMMSVDGETKRVMKGVQHGACDYLLKPIRMKELKNIWQHVVRKRMHEMKDIEYMDDRYGSDPSNSVHYSVDNTSFRKRKDADNKYDDKELSDSASTKKARVVWSVELHQKFVKAVNQIGIDSDKIGPKKILDLMNVPGLTRENVASHLQKYRLYLNRIRKGDKIDSCFGGMKNSESTTGGCSLPNTTYMQQNDDNIDHIYPRNQLSVGITDPKSSSLLPLTEQKVLKIENSDPHEASTSQVGLEHALGCAPDVLLESEFKALPTLEYCFNHPSLSPSINDGDNLMEMKPLDVKPEPKVIEQLSPMEVALGSFSESNPAPFGCVLDMALNMKKQNSGQGETTIYEEVPRESSIQSLPLLPTSHIPTEQGLDRNFEMPPDMNSQIYNQGSAAFGLLGEDLMFYWLQNGDSTLQQDFDFDYPRFLELSFPEHAYEVPAPRWGLDSDPYLFDCIEYPVDHGLLFS